MDELARHLRRLEEELFDPAIRASPEEIAKRLSPDFREIGSSGRWWTYEETIAALPTETPNGVATGEDFQLKMLADDVGLLTYRSIYRNLDGSERRTLRSSIWCLEADGNWRMLFHQGTKVG
jgi:hypothetical protein